VGKVRKGRTIVATPSSVTLSAVEKPGRKMSSASSASLVAR